MPLSIEQLEEEALRLPVEQRVRLAEHLLSSLDAEPEPTHEEAWLLEAERRYAAYREGRMSSRPADDVFRDAFRKLK